MASAIEQAAGAALKLAGMLDLILNVLYARIGSRVCSRLVMGMGRFVARAIWSACVTLTGRLDRVRALVLSAAAPFTLVVMFAFWATLLTVGAALMVHPQLGTGFQRSHGTTPTDFIAALYVGGSSLSIVANSDFAAQTGPMRLLVLTNALLGTSTLTLTLTYLMQIYRALQTRNALGLKIQSMSGGRSQAAELLARWGPSGRFETCYSSLAEVVGELAEVHEAHHLYPLLFYFRFDTDYPNPALYLSVLLESASLMHSALPEAPYRWLLQSAAVGQLWHGSLGLLGMLERVFVPARYEPAPPALDEAALRQRFHVAVLRLARSGIATPADETAAAARYLARLAQWYGKAHRVATYLAHDPAALLADVHET